MACLALSCFLIVVWLAALPNTPSPYSDRPFDMTFPDGLDMVDSGGAAALMWVYQDVKPVMQKRASDGEQMSDLPEVESSPASTPSASLDPAESPTPVPSFAVVRRAQSTTTSFAPPPYAENPSAAKVEDEDDASVSPANKPSSTPSNGAVAKNQRRSRLRRNHPPKDESGVGRPVIDVHVV
jgi:hypothetical protein